MRVTAPRTVRWHRGPMAPAGVTAMSPPPPPHRSLFSLLGFYGTGPRGKARSHTAPRRPPSDLGQRGNQQRPVSYFLVPFPASGPLPLLTEHPLGSCRVLPRPPLGSGPGQQPVQESSGIPASSCLQPASTSVTPNGPSPLFTSCVTPSACSSPASASSCLRSQIEGETRKARGTCERKPGMRISGMRMRISGHLPADRSASHPGGSAVLEGEGGS